MFKHLSLSMCQYQSLALLISPPDFQACLFYIYFLPTTPQKYIVVYPINILFSLNSWITFYSSVQQWIWNALILSSCKSSLKLWDMCKEEAIAHKLKLFPFTPKTSVSTSLRSYVKICLGPRSWGWWKFSGVQGISSSQCTVPSYLHMFLEL